MTSDDGVPRIDDWNRLLDGRVAVVTGGGDGIGAGITRLFAQHGALVEVAELDQGGADRIRDEVISAGGRVRGYYEQVEHPVTGPHRYPGWPFTVTPGPGRHHRFAPPTLGQHNEEILRRLGVTDDELDDMRKQRVIGETALNA